MYAILAEESLTRHLFEASPSQGTPTVFLVQYFLNPFLHHLAFVGHEWKHLKMNGTWLWRLISLPFLRFWEIFFWYYHILHVRVVLTCRVYQLYDTVWNTYHGQQYSCTHEVFPLLICNCSTNHNLQNRSVHMMGRLENLGNVYQTQ